MKNASSPIDIDRLVAIVQASSNALTVQESKNEILKDARRSLVTANAVMASLEQHSRSMTDGVAPDLTAARETVRRCRTALAASMCQPRRCLCPLVAGPRRRTAGRVMAGESRGATCAPCQRVSQGCKGTSPYPWGWRVLGNRLLPAVSEISISVNK